MDKRLLALMTVALTGACQSPPPPAVPFSGSSAALDRLAGEWSGSYESPGANRGGSIVFTLASGDDHAHGDIVMIPSGTTSPLRPDPSTTGRSPDAPSAQVLRIVFVRAAGDSVSGTLDPYRDPLCSCSASASFAGRLDGNTIRGTFVSRRADGTAMTGSWSVRRRG